MTYSYHCPECDLEHEFEVTPARPAPACQDHDSPLFSDPGDSAEVDGPLHCESCNAKFDEAKVYEAAAQWAAEQRELYEE